VIDQARHLRGCWAGDGRNSVSTGGHPTYVTVGRSTSGGLGGTDPGSARNATQQAEKARLLMEDKCQKQRLGPTERILAFLAGFTAVITGLTGALRWASGHTGTSTAVLVCLALVGLWAFCLYVRLARLPARVVPPPGSLGQQVRMSAPARYRRLARRGALVGLLCVPLLLLVVHVGCPWYPRMANVSWGDDCER